MTDNKTVADYNIQKESTIHLIIKKEINVGNFSIYINLLGKKKFIVDVNIHEKIKSIKENINESENIYIDDQNLFFCDKLLEDEKSINDYNIEENDIIICIVFDKYLNIKSDHKIIKVRYNELDTVNELKHKIENKNMSLYQKELRFNNTKLESDDRLKIYNIPNKSTIEVVSLEKNDKMLIKLYSGFGNEKQNVDFTKENEYSEMNKMLIYKIIELEQLLKEEKYIDELLIFPPIDDYKKEFLSVIFSSTSL